MKSTLNIDLILWHTQLVVCAENVKSWGFPFTFQAYILPHTLNCMCVSLFQCWTEGRSSTAVAEGLGPTATATVAEV